MLHSFVLLQNRLRLFWIPTLFILVFSLILASFSPVHAGGVVGTGTAVSCTEAAFDAALLGGGLVTFSCGGLPVTITVTGTKTISAGTTIDGGSLITISGGNTVRVFNVNAGITLNINNLTVANGFGLPLGSPIPGAGALLNNGGMVNITNSAFINNSDGGGRIGGAIVNYFAGTLNVSGSTFTNNTAVGVPGSGGSSGAILNYGILNITNSVFSNNSANTGGVTQNDGGTMTVSGSAFSNNSAVNFGGGGVFANGGILTITDSTFSGNTAAGDGGGAIHNVNGGSTLTVTGSTFTGNSASNQGGAILNGGGGGTAVLSVTNSTFTGNSAGALGGAIHNGCIIGSCVGGIDGNTTATNVTFSSNSAPTGGNLSNNAGTIAIINTIVANSVAGGNCSGAITDNGNSLQFGDSTCGGAILTADPLLGALANNGGPTQTMALGAGSPAIDLGNAAFCPAIDQRGLARPIDGDGDALAVCDIGAFEYGFLPPTAGKAFTPTAITLGGLSTLTFTLANPGVMALTNVAFTDNLPIEITVAAAPTVTNTCSTPGAVTATAGSGVITVAGAGLTASETCTITVQVTSAVAGTWVNTTGPISATESGAGATSNSATLTVAAPPAPGYASAPVAPGGAINVGTTVVGTPITFNLMVSETGNLALNVGVPGGGLITGPNATDFSLTAGSPPFTIADGGAAVTVAIRCNPSVAGLRTASLNFTSDDPANPTPTYTLNCTGTAVPPSTPTFTPTSTPASTSASQETDSGPASPPWPTPVGGQAVGSAGGTFSCEPWFVIIPPDTVPDGSTLHCGPFDPNVAPTSPDGLQRLNHPVSAHLYNNKGDELKILASPIQMCYRYRDADVSIARDAANFVIITAPPTNGTWEELPTTATTTDRHACGTTTHFTLFEVASRELLPTMLPEAGNGRWPHWMMLAALALGVGAGLIMLWAKKRQMIRE